MQRADRSKKPIVVNVSNRHFHCTQEVFEKLYGAGKKPTKKKDLLQPGQFACEETVTVRGTKGTLENVRMIGPLRPYTQVELSTTDTFTLGVRPPVRDSGNLKGSAPITIVGPQGSVDLPEGAIVAQRHIHFHPDEAKDFGVKNMETVRIKLGAGTPKETIFTILCRVREDMKLECHLDTDEANAAGIKNGDSAVML
ncbi:MAG TPA: phosphate propanoyltransferase [Elusimicrobiota bacterium]|nr:phosphate propanoyltransferase [Elusimicrobiota bacterium]